MPLSLSLTMPTSASPRLAAAVASSHSPGVDPVRWTGERLGFKRYGGEGSRT